MATKTTYFPMGGGLDVVSPALSVSPGRALTLVNFEPWFNGGYRRIYGYERFDGRPAPSEQTFTGFTVADATGLSVGDTVTGDTSSTTGVVCGVWEDDGTYGFDAIGVTKVSGSGFVNGEDLNTGSYTITSDATLRYAPSTDLEDTWLAAAYEEYRDDIDVVPGYGPVRGAWQRGSNVYAWRDDAASPTESVLHLASASGWTTTGITMGHVLKFNGGGGGAARALPVEGDTINGVTSGASATVHRVIVFGGTTGANDAVGYLVLTSVTSGPFQDTENLQEGGTTFAQAVGDSYQFTFDPGGTYRFRNNNFYGGSGTYRTYGVSGVGPAFEIDENNVVSPIILPTLADLDGADPNPPPDTDSPYLIEVHRNYLFLAYQGGKLVHTVIGEPLVINGFLGAAEFGLGDEITGLNSVVGGVLVITTERETRGLFGYDITDWELKLVGEKTGGKLYTTQKLDTVYALDDLGITSVSRTDQFGDFVGATVSQLIQPIVNSARDRATCSSIVRSSNQYRVYFDDGSALAMYVPNVAAGQPQNTPSGAEFGFLSYPLVLRSVYNTEDETGAERTLFVSDDGYVYDDQKGPSFDGAAINAYLRTAFYHAKTPSYRKRWRRCDLEIAANKPLTIKVISDLSYGATELSSSVSDTTVNDVPQIDIFAGGGFWDTDNWDEFYWDGQNISTARAELRGSGENISLLIYNGSNIAQPFIIQGAILHYDLRRLQR
jgi:hypothetical protein